MNATMRLAQIPIGFGARKAEPNIADGIDSIIIRQVIATVTLQIYASGCIVDRTSM